MGEPSTALWVLLEWDSYDGPDAVRVITDGAAAEAWKAEAPGSREIIRCEVDGPESRWPSLLDDEEEGEASEGPSGTEQ